MKLLGCVFGVLCSVACFAIELDERPAEPGDWGFHPVAGDSIERNPPGFTWRPVEEAAAYAIEIARDDGFDDVVYAAEDLVWSAHCPPVTLEPGDYYWRYAAVDKTGERTAWSSVRSFSIPKDAVAFPQPVVDDLIARLPEGHPRLFFRPDDISRFRALADGRLKGVYEGIIAKAEQLAESPPDTTEPPKYPPDMVRKSGEWKDMWWGNRKRTIAVLDGAATAAFAYRLSGNEAHGETARELLMAFAAWDPKGSTQYDYNDEAGMPALYYASRAYDWAYPVLSEAERAKMVEVMTVRGRDCFDHLRRRNHLWEPYASHSNRAWHFLGEVAIAFHDEIPEAQKWLDYAMTIFYTCYPVWTGGDGAWHEGIAYWSSYMSRFMYWAFICDSGFDIDVFERPFFKRTGDYGMYTMPPGTQTGGFGDQAQYSRSSRIAPFMAVLAAGAGNPHWKWYADAHNAGPGGGYLGFIYGARLGDVESQPPVDLPSSAVFAQTGLAVLNSNLLDGTENTQLFFKSSPLGRVSHGHNANNAFLINVNGERALQRAGRRDVHGSPHHRQYMWHSKSDNAILVNGEGQVKHSPTATGAITFSKLSDTVDVVVGEAGESYENLDRWTRRIVFLKPDVFVIHDVLEAPAPSTYTYTLHAENAFEIGENQADLSGDFGELWVHFLAPGDLNITQSNEYDPPPHDWANFEMDEWHLSAATIEKSAYQEFLTCVVANDSDVRIEHEMNEGETALVIHTADQEHRVVLSGDRFDVDSSD